MKSAHRETYKPMKIRGGHAQLIGYARVSTAEQDSSIAAQVHELKRAGCSLIYTETASGASAQPILAECVEALRKGDTLTVTRLDRLSRKLSKVVLMLDELDGEGVFVRSISQGINTRQKSQRDQFNLIACFAESERNLILERTREGLEAARRNGRIGGRKPLLTSAMREAIAHMKFKGESNRAIAAVLKVDEKTIRNALSQMASIDPRQLPLPAMEPKT